MSLMEFDNMVNLLKQHLRDYVALMKDVPGIEEYHQELADLQGLEAKCDELTSLAKQQQTMADELARAEATAKPVEAAVKEMPEIKPEEFQMGQPLDNSEVDLAIRKLVEGLLPAASIVTPKKPEDVAAMASSEWTAPSDAPTPPNAPPTPPKPPTPPAKNRDTRKSSPGSNLWDLPSGEWKSSDE